MQSDKKHKKPLKYNVFKGFLRNTEPRTRTGMSVRTADFESAASANSASSASMIPHRQEFRFAFDETPCDARPFLLPRWKFSAGLSIPNYFSF